MYLRSERVLTGVAVLLLLCTMAVGSSRPRIQFRQEVFDFGKLQTGEVVSHEFEFVNAGQAPLQVFDSWAD